MYQKEKDVKSSKSLKSFLSIFILHYQIYINEVTNCKRTSKFKQICQFLSYADTPVHGPMRFMAKGKKKVNTKSRQTPHTVLQKLSPKPTPSPSTDENRQIYINEVTNCKKCSKSRHKLVQLSIFITRAKNSIHKKHSILYQ